MHDALQAGLAWPTGWKAQMGRVPVEAWERMESSKDASRLKLGKGWKAQMVRVPCETWERMEGSNGTRPV